ncbi:MFS transporter [Salisediminibacterium selenitireducens]|uniref:MFS transporter n=1 Tax=Salisediminibacterium selenitireducens TaxID=85683 RepID=UPI000303F7C6|nr:MFS transporter [Salisediminibacterium selenitireducens]
MNSTWNIKGMLFFFHASMTIIISYMPVYFQYMGLSGSEIGILLAVGPAAAIIAQPFWGFVSDKYKTVKRIMLLCLSVALAVAFIVFQLTEFILLVPVMFIFFSFQSPAGGAGGESRTKGFSRTRCVLWQYSDVGLSRFCDIFPGWRIYSY